MPLMQACSCFNSPLCLYYFSPFTLFSSTSSISLEEKLPHPLKVVSRYTF